jgi:hypothetical protein
MKIIIYIFLILVFWQCKTPEKQGVIKPVYIYDSERLLEVHDFKEYINDEHFDSTIVRFIFRKSVNIPKYADTFLVGYKYKYYNLMFYLEYYIDDKAFNDKFFKKPKSYLDQIEYFDSKWLENEEKVDSFWAPINCWRCGGKYDTAKIFLILPVKNTDSVLFMQVHRWYDESVD